MVLDRRVLAADFDDYSNLTLVDATRVSGDAVTATDPALPGVLWFRATDLSGAVRVEAEVAGSGGRVEFRTGDEVLASLAVPATGGQYEWTTASADLDAAAAGVHDLQVVLHGAFRLAAFRFGTAD